MGGVFCGGTFSDANEPLVRSSTSFCGIAAGDLCCEASATLDWTVNVVQMRGTVSGVWAISGNAAEVFWHAQLRGRVGPADATGVLTGTSNTGLTLHGTWSYDGFVDPTAEVGAGFDVTAVVTS
jgi:hypothetical protein